MIIISIDTYAKYVSVTCLIHNVRSMTTVYIRSMCMNYKKICKTIAISLNFHEINLIFRKNKLID